MEDEFDDEIEDKIIENTPEMDKNIQNYIKRIPEPDEPESMVDPLSPLEQISRLKAAWRKQNPSVALTIARAKRDRNKI